MNQKTHLKVAVADALVSLQRWSAREVAGPEIVSAVCIREEVIRLQSPEMEGGKKKKWVGMLHLEYMRTPFVIPRSLC